MEKKKPSEPANGTNVPEYCVWLKIGSITLTQFDKMVLETEKEWITDSIINACQYLLQKEYPNIGGFQDVLLTQIQGFQPVEGKFVQILNENQNHWFTVSNIYRSEPSHVSIYDSKCNDRKDYTDETLKPVFAMLPNVGAIKFYQEQVTQQCDNSQCGLYAIAFAKALCSSRNPADILFSDDPSVLRKHLINCLLIGRIRNFPQGSKSPVAEFMRPKSNIKD